MTYYEWLHECLTADAEKLCLPDQRLVQTVMERMREGKKQTESMRRF